MMKLLALALLLCVLASPSNAQCFSKDVTPGQTDCVDLVDNTRHEVGTKWRNSACQDCTCSECCAAYSTPTGFPDDCIAEFDSDACVYVVHKKDDPSELCPVTSAVGK
ncbi:beta-microseminoprotein [Austrofundulus limnaeus]|uniref:Beta-microseminoprotein n=1 Tax=Austrofundulus limnaeus TaxID=52670 RepID=A0A2I4BIL5_AUSLI|nr:PREDICTED: beta-microseminoprotein-like [Austrofundulus limnaeus]